MAVFLSVIIPSFNRSAVLRKCLEALSRQDCALAEFEVIVVDDGSSDGTGAAVAELSAAGMVVRYLRQENRGPASARNRGIREAAGEVILFIGDDIICPPDLAARHIAFHRGHPDAAAALLGRVAWSPEIRVTPFMRWLGESEYQFDFFRLAAGDADPARYFYTANVSLKRSFLESRRLFFDEDFRRAAFEDMELGARLKNEGLALRYDPHCLAWHYHATSLAAACARMRVVGENGVLLDGKMGKIVPSAAPQPSLAAAFVSSLKMYVANAVARSCENLCVNGWAFRAVMYDNAARGRAAAIARANVAEPAPGIMLSIVIVSWNVKEYLEKCLRSVYAFTRGMEYEVFVVDNASTDGSVEMVRALFPQAVCIAGAVNLGFSTANNLAMRRARGKYVAMLNPDTELIGNSLKELVDYMEARGGAVCAAPRLTYGDGSLQHSCRHFPTLFTDLMTKLYLDAFFPRSAFFNRYKMGMWSHDREREVDQPYGACLVFRGADLRRLGYMDERYFMYYDEVDLCYRFKQAGGAIVYLPRISVIHHANRSSNQAADDCHRWKTQSQMFFYRKHYGAAGVLGLFFNLALQFALIFAVLYPVRALTGRPRDIRLARRVAVTAWREYRAALRRRS